MNASNSVLYQTNYCPLHGPLTNPNFGLCHFDREDEYLASIFCVFCLWQQRFSCSIRSANPRPSRGCAHSNQSGANWLFGVRVARHGALCIMVALGLCCKRHIPRSQVAGYYSLPPGPICGVCCVGSPPTSGPDGRFRLLGVNLVLQRPSSCARGLNTTTDPALAVPAASCVDHPCPALLFGAGYQMACHHWGT